MAGARTIVHVLQWPTVAGTEIATVRMIRGLSSPEWRHLALCAGAPSQTSRFMEDGGVPACAYQMPDLSFRRPGPFLAASLRASRLMRHLGADLVHCSDLAAGIYATLAARLARVPVVCHVRNPLAELSGRHHLLLRGVTRYIFVSRDSWARFAIPVGPDRGAVIYDGIDVSPLDHQEARRALDAELGIPPAAQLVGMVARLAEQKDHATFIRAAGRVVAERPDVRFLIVGDHDTTEAYRAFHRRLVHDVQARGLNGHVIFTGYRTDIPRLLAGLDVFVLATHFEGFGLAVIEAMAQGCPTISTAVGGVTEIVEDGVNGLLHRHADDADLAAKLLLVLQDGGLARRLGQAGLESVQTRFRSATLAKQVRAVYESVLE